MTFFHSMKWKVVWPILLVMAIIITIMAAIIYWYTANHLEKQGAGMTETARFAVENAIKARNYSEQILEKEMIGQSVMLALLVEKGTNYDELVALSKRSGIDEFWLTDEKGNTTLTNMAPKVDFNFGSDPNGQAYEFMDLIEGKREVVTQPAQVRTVDDQVFKFVGVTGWNRPQIVQVGRNGQALTELEEMIGVQAILTNMKKELSDQVLTAAIVSGDGKALMSSDEAGISNGALEQFNKIKNEKDITFERLQVDNKKAMLYAAPLSNGTYLVLVLSNEVLTGIANIMFLLTIATLVLFVLLVPTLVSKQLHHMDEITNSLLQISKGEGDLTVRLDASGHDEMSKLASAFNLMIEKIQNIMRHVQANGEHENESTTQLVLSADQGKRESENISTHLQDVSDDSSAQFERSKHASTMINEMMNAIQTIASASTNVADLTVDAAQKAQLGDKALHNVTNQMEHIEKTVFDSSQSVKSLDEGAQEISKIVGMISGIAEQTNLLALNASIEAARAGEHGKGFAVVAGEVRNLAEQTQHALQQIAALIHKNEEKSKESLKMMGMVSEEVSEGRDMVNQISTYFSDIYQSVHEVTAKVQDFTATTEEMSAGSNEVSESLTMMTNLAQSSAQKTEEISRLTDHQLQVIQEIATSAQDTANQTKELQAMINRFKVS
ncbi:methyl-accepting chemotaxis protein [Bacillus tianshenii]|nr:methyl-accepting chemotaxis protein [Bacillus tianshenii]